MCGLYYYRSSNVVAASEQKTHRGNRPCVVAMRGCIYSSKSCRSNVVVQPVAVPHRSRSLGDTWVATPHANCKFNRCIESLRNQRCTAQPIHGRRYANWPALAALAATLTALTALATGCWCWLLAASADTAACCLLLAVKAKHRAPLRVVKASNRAGLCVGMHLWLHVASKRHRDFRLQGRWSPLIAVAYTGDLYRDRMGSQVLYS